MIKKTKGIDKSSIERQIGWRLQQRRIELGLALADVDQRLGVKKGISKAFEEGTRFVGSSDLFALSEALDVEVSFFFMDVGKSVMETTMVNPDPETVIDARRLIHAYYDIQDQGVRRRVVDLLKDLAEDDPPDT